LVDVTLAHYFPGTIEVDDPSIREKGKIEAVNIDELITPLLALVARIAEEPGARKVLKEWILPADLNRDTPLEARGDTLGRCMRLMSSVYFPRMKDTIGETLFTICNSDGKQTVSHRGCRLTQHAPCALQVRNSPPK
jgi:Guanine nucleotide exchange factor synembryn